MARRPVLLPMYAAEGSLSFAEIPSWPVRVAMRLFEWAHAAWREQRLDWQRPYMRTGEVWWRPLARSRAMFEVRDPFGNRWKKKFTDSENWIWFDLEAYENRVFAETRTYKSRFLWASIQPDGEGQTLMYIGLGPHLSRPDRLQPRMVWFTLYMQASIHWPRHDHERIRDHVFHSWLWTGRAPGRWNWDLRLSATFNPPAQSTFP